MRGARERALRRLLEEEQQPSRPDEKEPASASLVMGLPIFRERRHEGPDATTTVEATIWRKGKETDPLQQRGRLTQLRTLPTFA